MASLQVRGPDWSVTKQKAIEDAKKLQKSIVELCSKSGKEIPKYQLSELIGKGSFGRVYKGTSLTTKKLVAVKIIDIEESDTLDPKLADTYSDLLKEISALQLLGESGARNINLVIEALPVGQSMWIITDYCAGGSVSTLMKPTSPGGLQEKWIVPILREVAEAMFWVHEQGIIHRDIKCANVLVGEVGDVQLCDFGVAGVIETKFDKRTTVIGTPHWMAPELFDPKASYGTEVDIWAFGAMIHEIATGLPPNVAPGMDFMRLGSHLKNNTPRLEGDQYSPGLKDLASYCFQQDPTKRPSIHQIQRHKYLFKTEEAYPTSSLSHLVRGFKLWEAQGGARQSLFSAVGAQGPSEISAAALANDEWNFSTTAAFDQQVFNNGDAQDVFDVYGSNVDFSQQTLDETSRPQKSKGRRRPPPQLPSVKAPLEKIFDPNTMTSYDDNSRAYYGRPMPPPASDLPLRDDSTPSADVRESLIDLDSSLHGSDLSQFVDLNTIRAGDSRTTSDYDFADMDMDMSYEETPHFNNAPLSDPAELSNNRRTRDWKFPTMPPPASADAEMSRFPFSGNGSGSGSEPSRPPLLHHPTEPMQPSAAFNDLAVPKSAAVDARASVGSLIDLDMSFADSSTDYTRPSTSHSDVGSISGSEIGGANPFELEKHASLYVGPTAIREPSIYVSDDSEFSNALADLPNGNHRDEPPLPNDQPQNGARPYSLSEFADTDPEEIMPQQPPAPQQPVQYHGSPSAPYQDGPSAPYQDMPQPQYQDMSSAAYQHSPPREDPPGPAQFREGFLPPLPTAPSPLVMQGQASSHDIREELRRLAMSLGDHLSYANEHLSSLPVRRGSITRMEPLGDTV